MEFNTPLTINDIEFIKFRIGCINVQFEKINNKPKPDEDINPTESYMYTNFMYQLKNDVTLLRSELKQLYDNETRKESIELVEDYLIRIRENHEKIITELNTLDSKLDNGENITIDELEETTNKIKLIQSSFRDIRFITSENF